mgnify:CR=1 FL=1
MKLIKTTFLSGIITFAKLISGFISNKIAAIIIGPNGLALMGIFSNFISITFTFSNGGINNGVVRFVAENESDEGKLRGIIGTAYTISVYCSLFIGALICIFSSLISELIFNNFSHKNIIIIFGFSIILYSLNSLIISIINGKKDILKYTYINVIGSGLGIIITSILVYYFKSTGALYALFLSQCLIFFITILLVRKSNWIEYFSIKQTFSVFWFKKLARYSIMSIITAVVIPLSQMIIRDYIISKHSLETAGIWQGMTRISENYLMIITTSLSVYYLPKLASIKSNFEIAHEIRKIYKLIIPFLLLSCYVLYIFRIEVISILYADSFYKMSELFFFQLLGDVFKICAWVLSYIMLAKSMIKMYIITEVLFGIIYSALSIYLISIFGLKGSVLSFSICYLIYFIVLLILFRKIIFPGIHITNQKSHGK